MNIQPTIQQFKGKKLIGTSLEMSLAENRIAELWKKCMPLKPPSHELESADMYSVEVYPNDYFLNFSPQKTFNKWAAFPALPNVKYSEELSKLEIPAGLYACFHYIGSSANAQALYQYIFNQWLPASGYQLDQRPHFALMGAKYQNNHPDSEEDIWIPIKNR